MPLLQGRRIDPAMPTSPLEFVVVERFPPLFRAYRWTDSSADADCVPPIVGSWIEITWRPPEKGDWVLWDPEGLYGTRVKSDRDFRAMYQLPSGEPIP